MSGRNAPEDATIFALASGAGRAGIAVIRLSGRDARLVCEVLTGKPLPAARDAVLRRLADPRTGETIDRGLVLWFEGPASFTGEDVLELHVHGGPAVLASMFDVLQSVEGVRPAHPGEFSRRAFMNGKMDLTAAEGLADLVAAETEQQARQARRQMEGALGRLYQGWHQTLLGCLARLEAEIDFAAEEDVPDGLMAAVRPALSRLRIEIAAHLADDRRGERLRQGLRLALIGPPNAGKSSLINILAKRDVAIVTAMPGTTRDVLEVPLDLGGYPVTIADMAGLRHTDDPIEALGVTRAESEAEQADIRLALFDGATWPVADERTVALLDDRSVILLNKADLLTQAPGVSAAIGDRDAMLISCRTCQGIDRLIDRLTVLARDAMTAGAAPLLTRTRHRQALIEVEAALLRIDETPADIELALVAEDLRLAMRSLGRITGMVGVEDLLDRIFGEFCIGK